MKAFAFVLAGVGLALTSCAPEPPADTACWIKPQTYSTAAAPPERMVVNASKLPRTGWCSYSSVQMYGSGNVPFSGAKLVVGPSHGLVVIRQRNTGPMAYYRPIEGFVGEDRFEIDFAGGGRRIVLVTVTAG